MKVVAAILPSRSPEIFGPTPKPEHFRYSRGKRHFVLNENSDIKTPEKGADDEDTLTLGEPGIMQQVSLNGMDDLREELAHQAERYPAEFTPIQELIDRLWERRSLTGRDLETLREMLESYTARRPSGTVVEVREFERRRGSFWPNHHADGIWFRHAKGCIGADTEGVFFLNADGEEYFRSKRFKQEREDRFRYQLVDEKENLRVDSPIVICDCWYDEDAEDEAKAEYLSGYLEDVIFTCFHFRDSVGKLILQLQTMAKLGVIIGQPVLIAENEFRAAEEEDTLPG